MVTRTSRRRGWTLALGLLGGCTDAPGGATTTSRIALAPREPVIVTLGGFDSCATGPLGPTPEGTARWETSARLSRRFAAEEPQWVRGCFDITSRLYWIASDAPTTVRSTTLDALGPFLDAVNGRVGDGARRPVFLLGHSYGGWLAMRAAWSLPPSADLRLLFTVDPISPNECTVGSYLRAVASPLTAPWSLAGCQHAPTDFTRSARQRIVTRVSDGGFRHYYQRNFVPLRSSAMEGDPQPHRTYDVSAFLTHLGGVHPAWNAHVAIADLSIVWYSFEASIERDLTAE